MTSHSETKFLPYGAKEMFDLVADISSYPEFLPWCAAARIRKEIQKGEVKQIEADLIISFKVFREKFGSRVLLDPVKYSLKQIILMDHFGICIQFGVLETVKRAAK